MNVNPFTQSAWDPLDNSIQSYYQSVATWGGGFTEIFGTDPAGALWHRFFGPRGWSNWTSVPGPGPLGNYPPAVAALPNGALALSAVTRDGKMWIGVMVQHQLLRWLPVSSPEQFVNTTLLYTAGTFHVFALTQRNHTPACNPLPSAPPAGPECGVWHFTIAFSIVGRPILSVSAPEYLGGPPSIDNQVDQGAPVSAMPIGPTGIFLQAKSYDGNIWQTTFTGTRWSGWFQYPPPQATAPSGVRWSPTVVMHNNPNLNIDLYYLGGDLQLHWSNLNSYTLAWSTAVKISGPVISPYSPGSSVSFIDGETDLYITGLNGVIYHKRFDSRTPPLLPPSGPPPPVFGD